MSGSQQPLLGYGGGSYKIANSLRFRSSASAYLNRTPASAGNQKTWTWSGWLKLGSVIINGGTIHQVGSVSTTLTSFSILSDATIRFQDYLIGIQQFRLITTQVFRDPSSWYHIVLAVDTTQITDSNRVKIYVNGVQVTAFSTANYPLLNANTNMTAADLNRIGCISYTTASDFYDGYLADINFIDGQALTPSSFGETNVTTGVWQPKQYTGSYGTNGFKLNFSNGTSTTTLGYDSSGNGNNWTTNNISLTAGSTYDWMIDSPTPYQGSSYGVGNYCTWNPLTGTSGTVTNANLYFAGSSAWASRLATIAIPVSGKFYYEVTITSAPFTPRSPATDWNWIGFALATNFNISSDPNGNNVNAVVLGDNGYINNFTTTPTDTGYAISNNDVIGIAIDTGANTYTFYKNNSSIATGTIGTTAGTTLVPFQVSYGTTYGAMQANFGQRPFAYTPPSGYKSLCTYNLPTPTIQNGAGYMAATTYTGTGVARSVSNTTNGISFAPDFVWIKDRTTAYSHILFDTIRGAGNYLISNGTLAELTDTNYMSAFTSTGFSVGTSAVSNGNTEAYVGWQWKAGGTAVTNTAGSITSSVSANTTSGFSVVTYTGNNTVAATFGHGLGVIPSFAIIKRRDNTGDWFATMVVGSGVQRLLLNTTAAGSSGSPISTFFTSTTIQPWYFDSSGSGLSNVNSATYVAYCFAAIPGYSAFGSYTGNGSTDGPFVYCGFRPRWILIKRSDVAGTSWRILDTSRSVYNIEGAELYPDTSEAEGTSTALDGLSNGFKIRNTFTPYNASGGTYIYAAFAENPFNLSLAR